MTLSPPRSPPEFWIPPKPEDKKMPTERKSTWRTAEERRLSDLTRVLEWLERRRKKKITIQKPKIKDVVLANAKVKEDMKNKALKQQEQNHKVSGKKAKEENAVQYRKLYGMDIKGKRLSIVPSNYNKEFPKKSEVDVKDANPLEFAQRSMRRQSIVEPMLQDAIFGSRKSTLLRDWTSKSTEASYERKLKSLMDKSADPKIEVVKMLKPEEVLSCRYLRLSKNNIRTLIKLCKDAGMDVDIHPHMVESEIDAKKNFCSSKGITKRVTRQETRVEDVSGEEPSAGVSPAPRSSREGRAQRSARRSTVCRRDWTHVLEECIANMGQKQLDTAENPVLEVRTVTALEGGAMTGLAGAGGAGRAGYLTLKNLCGLATLESMPFV
ncbi:uncharacterized protein C16orf78 homolog [Talpa occidentalis]|uniref:uncharacterized protein C16orf78 homolog n=1 Tax=Talpa occidentalis TaxID=50954 RepID=UPI0023F94227|nr:uncharacterized protein C16orf78 homolog [Talpa occidentalis]